MITVREQIERAEKARLKPPKPALDPASIKLIDAAYVAKGRVGKLSRDDMVKAIGAMSMNERASALMALAMARPVVIS